MAVSQLSARGGKAGETAPLHMRVTPAERRRVKAAAAAAGMSYAELFLSLLDERDARFERARRLQSSPLHRNQAVSSDDGEGEDE